MPTTPWRRSAFARPSATVDLPTPPLPAPTATTRRKVLADEGRADLALGRCCREDGHAVADLKPCVVVGVQELALAEDACYKGAARKSQAVDGLARGRRARCHVGLDHFDVRAGERHDRHEAARGKLLLDDVHEHAGRGDRLVDPERLEHDLVLGVVHARDHAWRMAVQLRQLADDEVLRIVAGHRDERIGTRTARLHLRAPLVRGRVHDDRAELVLDEVRAAPVGLVDRHLVPGLENRLREMEPNSSGPVTNEVHLYRALTGSWARSSSCASDLRMSTSPTSRSSCSMACRSVPRIVVRENVSMPIFR